MVDLFLWPGNYTLFGCFWEASSNESEMPALEGCDCLDDQDDQAYLAERS